MSAAGRARPERCPDRQNVRKEQATFVKLHHATNKLRKKQVHAGEFLISMPKLRGSFFGDSLIYLWAHDEDGAQGLVVNHPFDLTLAELMKQLDMPAAANARPEGAFAGKVVSGGPVEPQQGFILHTDDVSVEGSQPAAGAGGAGLIVSYSREMLELIAAERGPNRFLLALGYAGWGAGQLEQELAEGAWLTAPSSHDVLFETPFEQRLDHVAHQLGIDWRLFASEGGVA